jgi:hypothetical protein
MMNKLTQLSVSAALATSVGMLFSAAAIAGGQPATAQVAGEKIDSGLGDLPHYRHWSDPTGKGVMPQQNNVKMAKAQPAKAAGEQLSKAK